MKYVNRRNNLLQKSHKDNHKDLFMNNNRTVKFLKSLNVLSETFNSFHFFLYPLGLSNPYLT